jgi:hypothetical protein
VSIAYAYACFNAYKNKATAATVAVGGRFWVVLHCLVAAKVALQKEL